jgi:hypothetical protein
MVIRVGERGAVVVGEPEASAIARLIPPAATRAIKAKVIPSRLVM